MTNPDCPRKHGTADYDVMRPCTCVPSSAYEAVEKAVGGFGGDPWGLSRALKSLIEHLDSKPRVPLTGPVPMLLWCPNCGERHLDVGEFATKPHHTHACQDCGMVWRPAIVHTVGVHFLPGFKNGEKT